MTKQITLEEVLKLVSFVYKDNCWHVDDVYGDVQGDVKGNVVGNVYGYVEGDILFEPFEDNETHSN